MDILIDDFGMSLGKKSERLIIKKRRNITNAIFNISQITLSSSEYLYLQM